MDYFTVAYPSIERATMPKLKRWKVQHWSKGSRHASKMELRARNSLRELSATCRANECVEVKGTGRRPNIIPVFQFTEFKEMHQEEAEGVSSEQVEESLQALVHRSTRLFLENGPLKHSIPNIHSFIKDGDARKVVQGIPSAKEVKDLIDEVLHAHEGGIVGFHANQRDPAQLKGIARGTAGFGIRHWRYAVGGGIIGPYKWMLKPKWLPLIRKLFKLAQQRWAVLEVTDPDHAEELRVIRDKLVAKGVFPIPNTCFYTMYIKRVMNTVKTRSEGEARETTIESRCRTHVDDKDIARAHHLCYFEELGGVFGFPEHKIGYLMKTGDAISFNPHAYHGYFRSVGLPSGAQRRFITFHVKESLLRDVGKANIIPWPKGIAKAPRNIKKRRCRDLTSFKWLAD